jgi:TRAP-type C4-dicarboxylate transport system substrate-binding protein
MRQFATKLAFAASVLVVGAPAALTTQAAAQQEITLTVAAGQPTRAMRPLAMVSEYFIPEVNKRMAASGLDKKYKINWKDAYAGSLLKPTMVLEGTRDGITDIGFEPTIFHPDKLPLEQITFATPFVTSDVELVGRTMNKMHAQFPEYRAMYDKFNVVRLGGSSYDSYELFSTFPVAKFDDVKGKKIATAGAALQWIRGTGATPVQSNMTEYYNSSKTGVIDGFIIFPSAVGGMKYPEAAPHLTRVGFGAQYAAALIINKDVYNKLPAEVRKVLHEAGESWNTEADKAMRNLGEEGFKAVPSFPNAKATTLARDEQVKWAGAMPNVAKEWAERAEKAGYPGNKVLSAYMDEMRKAGAKPVRDWDKN